MSTMIVQYDNELYHYGVKGMRWGVIRKRLTSSVEKRKKRKADKQKVKELRRQEELKRQQEEERREEEERARQREIDKRKALMSGNVKEVSKYQNEYTTQELRDAVERIQLSQKLSSLNTTEQNKYMKKIDKAVDNLGKINKYAKTSIDTYENVKKIRNILEDIRNRNQ